MAMGHDTIERWLPVVGYEGLYEVSDHGRVRSLDREYTRRDGVKQFRRGIPRKLTTDPSGHKRVRLSREGKGSTKKVHRLVLEAFVGPCPRGHEACHDNGDPADNRLQNLRWDTPSANELDKVTHGTHHHAKKTHCPRGHELVMPNLVPSALANGGRACLACQRAHSRVWDHPELKPRFQQIADDYHRAIMSVYGQVG